MFVHHLRAELAKLGQVGLRHQAVGQHALALVQPQARHLQRRAERALGHAADALCDVGQLPQVELVVELDCRGSGEDVIRGSYSRPPACLPACLDQEAAPSAPRL